MKILPRRNECSHPVLDPAVQIILIIIYTVIQDNKLIDTVECLSTVKRKMSPTHINLNSSAFCD